MSVKLKFIPNKPTLMFGNIIKSFEISKFDFDYCKFLEGYSKCRTKDSIESYLMCYVDQYNNLCLNKSN